MSATKIPVGISLDRNLIKKIDLDRGDISRSKYIVRALERLYGNTEIIGLVQ